MTPPAHLAPTGVVLTEGGAAFHDPPDIRSATKKAARGGLSGHHPNLPRAQQLAGDSALTGFETRVRLADHEHLAATAHDLAVAMPLFRGLQGRKHFHGRLLGAYSG
jgi:hypothetical protein